MSLGSASIFDDIHNGYWDEGLDALMEVIAARRKYVRDQKGAQNMVQFGDGTPVRIVNIRPKYLTGITGKVDKSKMPNRRGDLVVQIDQHHWHRLGRYSHTLHVPASSLELI